MWINPKNNRAMVVGNDGGGTVSVNGSPWTPQENQPTSEIYRLTVDTRVPYWVYGAQQDNSTVAVPSQGNAATYGVGGGESGYIAVDPRDYNIVYAGNYGGTISRIDRKFGTQRERQGLRRHGDGPARRGHEIPLPVELADPHLAEQSRRRLHDVAGRAPHDATAASTGK